MYNGRFLRALLVFSIVIFSIHRLARLEHWPAEMTAVFEIGMVLAVALIWIHSIKSKGKIKSETYRHIEPPATGSPPETHKRKSTATNMRLTAAALLIAGCFSMRPLYSALDFAYALHAQQNWPSANGKVLTAHVEPATSKAGRIYWHPVWSYSYIVGGNSYTSGSRDLKGRFALVDFPTRNDANAIASQRPAGAEVRVYYDPFAPQRSVLDRRTWTAVDWIAMLVATILPVITFGTSAFLFYRASSSIGNGEA